MITSQTWKRGAWNGLKTSGALLQVIIPVFAVVSILSHTPVINWIAEICEPVMNVAGLPGEAAIAFVTGVLVSMYAAVAIIIALSLTPWQITTLAVMLTICHELVMENAVIKKTGASVWPFVLLRLSGAFLVGGLMNYCHGFLS